MIRNRHEGSGGQATLEMTTVLILSVMLLIAAVRLFVWLNGRIVQQQIVYDQTRVAAGSIPQDSSSAISNMLDQDETKGVEIDVSEIPELSLF